MLMRRAIVKTNPKALRLLQCPRQLAGQALFESMGLLLVAAIILGSSLPLIHGALKDKHESAMYSRNQLWQHQPQEVVKTTRNYPFAERLGSTVGVLKQLTALELEVNNLRYFDDSATSSNLTSASMDAGNNSPRTLPMALLSDGWSVKATDGLVSEPRRLTLGHYLDELGFTTVLNWSAKFLLIMKEFKSDSLKLGHVEPDATPYELACKESRRGC